MPKNKEAKLIIDNSAITDHLKCPKFYLPSVFQLIQRKDFKDMFLVKIDLKDAFFHLNVHKDSRYVTTFKHLNKYYRYCFLPFSMSVSPFYMQIFCNCITNRFVREGCLAWSHIDDILVGHTDSVILQDLLDHVFLDLALSQLLLIPHC